MYFSANEKRYSFKTNLRCQTKNPDMETSDQNLSACTANLEYVYKRKMQIIEQHKNSLTPLLNASVEERGPKRYPTVVTRSEMDVYARAPYSKDNDSHLVLPRINKSNEGSQNLEYNKEYEDSQTAGDFKDLNSNVSVRTLNGNKKNGGKTSKSKSQCPRRKSRVVNPGKDLITLHSEEVVTSKYIDKIYKKQK